MAVLQIDHNTTIADIVGHYPFLTDILVTEYGFHCVGCFASEFETLGEGAVVHGLNEAELEELIQALQDSVSKNTPAEPSLTA